MGKIEKIIKKGSVEGQTTEVYPVTSTKAVYDENNKRLDNIITGLQESVYDVVYKNKLTPILQEIDLSGTDTDRKAKLDQFAVDWKALTGADTLDGAKFVGYSGEPDDFWGIFIYNSSIEGYSAIAISAHPSTYQVFIFPTGTIISNSLFYHLTPVIIRTGNTDSDMANNVAAIKEYTKNLTYLGVYTYLGFTIPVSLIGNNFCGYLVCDEYKGDGYVLSGTVFFKGIVKSIVIDETGRYEEIVDITGTNPLNTTSDNMVDAINEVNTLAKSKGNGTITEVRMNGASKGTSGVVDLGTVLTEHQDISGKQDKLISGTNIKTINGESVLGSGDITISSAYPEVNHGTGDTTFTLTPNTFHVWDRVPSLTLDFGSKTSGVMNEYLFQFKSGSTATSLTLPNSIKWVNDSVPTIKPKMIYQVNILNGLANVLEFSSAFNVNNYLTIEALEDNLTATFTNDVEYAIDGDEWVKLASGSETQPINVGQTLSFRGEFTPAESNGIGTFTINKKCNLKGNCMSMLFGDNAADNYSLSGKDYAFYKLFYGCSNIVNISSNFLPATTLAYGCYSLMFQGCSSLTTAPELPATTLADYCYVGMFYDCTSLTTVPSNLLPATTLADSCYQGMFIGCTSLTKAPELPATTLVNSCYSSMFNGCTKLTTAPELPATTLADSCYFGMFASCTSLTTAPELPATTLAMGCYSGMFAGCTSLTTVLSNLLPATTLANNCYDSMFWNCTSLTTVPSNLLPATTLTSTCYQSMFGGCSSLTVAPELPATTLAMGCYFNMFMGCTSLTTAPELPATTLASKCYSSMFQNCASLNYIKCLATDISAANCTYNWVSGVASTGTFVKSPNMTSWRTGTSGIPTRWTVEDNQEPLTFNILSAGTINWTASNTDIAKTIDYKLNDNEWASITSNTGSSAPSIEVNSGDKLQFRGNNAQYATDEWDYNSFSGSTALFEAEGNIMSLIYGDNFKNNLTISSAYTFYGLFSDCTGLTSAENLVLPATTLAENCYASMFNGCTKLTAAPALPATSLATSCYNNMFAGCKSLITATELPATTLADNCYNSMFYGCTSLTTAPELPSTTLTESCYNSMFNGCTSLTTAPALPVITLAMGCYQGMFYGCTNLNYIKCLATDISAFACTDTWVDGVASTGTFVKATGMTNWTTGNSGIPTGWTVQNV